MRSPYTRGSTTAAAAIAARTQTRTGRRPCQQRQLQGRRNRQRQPRQLPWTTVVKCALWCHGRAGFALVPCGHRTRRQYTIRRNAMMTKKTFRNWSINKSHNQSLSYSARRTNVYQRAIQLSLPHVGISKTASNRTTNIKPMSSSYNTPWIKYKLVVSIYSTLKQVSRCPPLRYGAALSILAMSVPTILMVSRCQVSRFQSPRADPVHYILHQLFAKAFVD